MLEKYALGKCFMYDPIPRGATPTYEGDPEISPFFALTSKLHVESKTANRMRFQYSLAVNIKEIEFEKHTIYLLRTAGNKNTYLSFKEIYNHYSSRDLSLSTIIYPRSGPMHDRVRALAVLSNNIKLIKCDTLHDYAITLAPPEFLGVLFKGNPEPDNYSINDNSLAYGLAVCNGSAVCILK